MNYIKVMLTNSESSKKYVESELEGYRVDVFEEYPNSYLVDLVPPDGDTLLDQIMSHMIGHKNERSDKISLKIYSLHGGFVDIITILSYNCSK